MKQSPGSLIYVKVLMSALHYNNTGLYHCIQTNV